ncbi:hypothetical protein F0562_012841 [Nyssa sinensis]|uniref:Histone-lysine N-methyltransferase n=1 Tax=Nyssa sinensis TaxID=561372 RepID=A0A5J4ZWU6_9ASTE|nr:hypothetical protein F0562_012841 [Nyssa sinensis]
MMWNTGPLKETVGAGMEGGSLRGTVMDGVEEGPSKDGVEDRPLRETLKAGVEGWPLRKTLKTGLRELEGDVQDGNAQKSHLKGTVPAQKSKIKGIVPHPRNKSQTILKKGNEGDRGLVGNTWKDVVVYSHGRSLKRKASGDPVGLRYEVDSDRVIVQGLMAAPNCPWRQGKGASKNFPDGGLSVSKVKKHEFAGREKSKPVTRTNNYEADYSGAKSMKGKSMSAGKAGALVARDEEDSIDDEEQHKDSPAGQRARDFDVSLPPFGPNSSSHGDARNKVRETLRLFQAICRKLLQGEEAKLRQREARSKQQGNHSKRIDLQAAEIIKVKKREVNTGIQILGAVPGVEVGDEFQYRVELALVGIHRLLQAGIDYMKHGGVIVATSIVASGGYADDLDNADVLIYSGQGGNMKGPRQPEDQKLERGNLALKNSILAKNPVRVIRGFKETKAPDSSDARAKLVATYTYDGLYTVEKYWQEPGPHGKLVFKFELWRIPGQPELAWKELKKSKKFKTREGLCVDDISGGKELFPLCAVNMIDNEKPPPFTYIIKMMYPDWYRAIPPKGCDCSGGCSDSQKCSCAVKNGGEIPYNHNGAIVEVKPLVYECGPSCKCPPSCYNRVTQHGIKIQLEIFKTESRGWGVRSLTSIPSGSFICEYTGELLEDKEAEQRAGNDEYLFDIGQNYYDCSLSDGPHVESSSHEVVEDGGYTIDAAQYGNVGRFINHSCSPNLYAQNVLYDHDDKRMPHIMLFAAENIPPLQELTYHYNYSIDQIRDSKGNIKMKRCYCGSTECTGRMY